VIKLIKFSEQVSVMDLKDKKARVGRASWFYRAYLDQDLFGVPVTLTFQGRD
jgi:hypothetical protein